MLVNSLRRDLKKNDNFLSSFFSSYFRLQRQLGFLAVVAVVSILLPMNALATDIMPSFADVPTGWVTDRYQPASFSNVGTFEGMDDVLGIGISSAQDFANRPSGYQSTFYNTQGMNYSLTGGAGSVLSADLWIPDSWSKETNGDVRTDMWGVMSDANGVTTDYPIIGFTNYGGSPEFRVWDESINDPNNNDWVNLTTPINYGSWNSLSIDFTGTSYVYSINGQNVYTDNNVEGSTGFSAVIMQAYNFGDSSLSAANTANYTAYWANTPTPEPSTMLLLGFGLVGLAGVARKKMKI